MTTQDTKIAAHAAKRAAARLENVRKSLMDMEMNARREHAAQWLTAAAVLGAASRAMRTNEPGSPLYREYELTLGEAIGHVKRAVGLNTKVMMSAGKSHEAHAGEAAMCVLTCFFSSDDPDRIAHAADQAESVYRTIASTLETPDERDADKNLEWAYMELNDQLSSLAKG